MSSSRRTAPGRPAELVAAPGGLRTRSRRRALWALAPCVAAACAGDSRVDAPTPPAMVVLRSISPTTILPRSQVLVDGDNLFPAAEQFLALAGAVDGRPVQLTIPLEVDEHEGRWQLDEEAFATFEEGTFQGTAQVISRNEWAEVRGPMLSLSLRFTRTLTPTLNAIGNGIVFLGTAVPIEGNDFLLGGAEGTTAAELAGCFAPDGVPADECAAKGRQVQALQLVLPEKPGRRRGGRFSFSPALAGIAPGRFEGTVTLANRHPDGTVRRSAPLPAQFSLQPSYVAGFDQRGVSLGEMLLIHGEGLIEGTGVRFDGTFTPSRGGSRPVQFELVVSLDDEGRAVHVVEEDNGIGAGVDLRREFGSLSGTWTPVIRYGASQEQGDPVSLVLGVRPVRQVVWIRFTDGWADALRKYGLQAADRAIRDRILEVFKRDYAGVNLDPRLEEPTDFKLYSRVDITGQDPNNAGQFGLDATPGKDTDNMRLHDIIGGVNAETQKDGYRGYGGVFAESIMGISTHPPEGIRKAWIQSPLFDKIFDPLRPDIGQIASSTEVAAAPALASTVECPSADRLLRVACAIRVLGNLVGTTATHEVGHSLGLSKPYNGSVNDCHNSCGPQSPCLMDDGGSRPFEERAELNGLGPAVFCDEDYAYLQKILPPETSTPAIQRPTCF